MEKVKCLILGGGPAGFTAAIYASRANLEPVLYEGIQPGGQLTTTTLVENFPGFPGGVDAITLTDGMREQARNFGADIRQGSATKADLSQRPFRITIDDEKEIEAETLIIATGAQAKYLGLESEKKYMGMGVSACATCDGFFYRKRTVAVVGGGDTACEEALYLAAAVTGARLLRKDGTTFDIEIDGFFLGIGHAPGSALFEGQLELDANGFIVTKGKTSCTSVDGVFAAGDVQDPTYKQAVTAAASGCVAARDAEKYLHQQ